MAVPPIAILLGYAGLIPFVALSLGLWFVSDTNANQINQALLTYAAIILSFMGAIHWGLAISDNDRIENKQLTISVLPALVAWFASLANPLVNYSLLTIAFATLCVYDGKMVQNGKAPSWYPKLRTPLTTIVVTSLITAQLAIL